MKKEFGAYQNKGAICLMFGSYPEEHEDQTSGVVYNVRWHDVAGPIIELCNDSWAKFSADKELREALAKVDGQCPDLKQFMAILRRIGYNRSRDE